MTSEPNVAEQSIIESMRENPLIWGLHYFKHHFRGPSPGFHLKILLESLKNLYLAIASPRESAKSTIITFLLPSHTIAFKRKRFIIICQSTYAKAVRSLETIKKEFRENEWLKRDFKVTIRKDSEGESIFRHADGFETQVLCSGRDQIGALRGSKFGAYRPDLIIVDDLEDDEMVRNPDRRLDLKNNFDEVILLLGERNTVQVIVIGTILHDDSQMAKLVDAKQYLEFRKLLYRGRNKMGDGSYQSLWEYKWTVEELNQMEKDNPSKFAKEIQNDPSTGLLQDIHVEDFRYWYKEENQYVLLDETGRVVSRGDFYTCKAAVGCDLAWDDKRQDDFSVIMPGFLTPQSDILIDDYICKKGLRPDEMEEILFSMEARLKSLTKTSVPFGFEKAKAEKIMQWLMRQAMKKRNKALWFKPLVWDTDKITRIVTRLQPRYKQHMIYHKRGMGDLERQLVRVRSAAHDDLADALQGLVQLLEYPKQERQPEVKDNDFMWWRQQAIESKKTPKDKAKRYLFGVKNNITSIPAQVGFR